MYQIKSIIIGGIMFNIEKQSYGFKLTFSGIVEIDEMKNWVSESKKVLAAQSSGFNVMIDMRNLKPVSQEVKDETEKGQQLYKQKGMSKSVVILASAILTLQFRRIAKDTGIYAWERYINASKTDNWEEVALNWLIKGIDPDQK